MPKRNYNPEQIINSLREAEVLLSQGNTTAEVTQAPGYLGTDLLQMEKAIWWNEDKPG